MYVVAKPGGLSPLTNVDKSAKIQQLLVTSQFPYLVSSLVEYPASLSSALPLSPVNSITVEDVV